MVADDYQLSWRVSTDRGGSEVRPYLLLRALFLELLELFAGSVPEGDRVGGFFVEDF